MKKGKLTASEVLKWIVMNPMEIIASVALIICILVTVSNAITRYVFRWTWHPGTDVTTLWFGYLVFCGSAAAYKRKMHYGIDVVVSHLPAPARKTAELLAHLITLAAMTFAAYLSVDLFLHVGGKIMPNTKISFAWFDLSAVIGFIYMAIYELIHTIETIRDFIKPRNTETEVS